MKKYIILFLLILTLTACKTEKEKEVIIPEINEEEIESYNDTNPIKVGLYANNKLIKTFTSAPAYHKDAAVFNVYFTNEEVLENIGIKNNFNKYFKQYDNIDDYKIGFSINYYAEEKEIRKTILDPSTMHSMDPYLYIYLYDDIHQQDGAWYSHLEDKDMNDDTLTTSIKLFYAGRPELIKFPIKLTVFTYKDKNDFTEDNEYRGNSYYTIEILDK